MSRFDDMTYVIVETSDNNLFKMLILSDNKLESSRKTNDGSKVLLGWSGDMPGSDTTPFTTNEGVRITPEESPFKNLTTYNYSEILEELKKSEWN